jgi:hypothetical protein
LALLCAGSIAHVVSIQYLGEVSAFFALLTFGSAIVALGLPEHFQERYGSAMAAGWSSVDAPPVVVTVPVGIAAASAGAAVLAFVLLRGSEPMGSTVLRVLWLSLAVSGWVVTECAGRILCQRGWYVRGQCVLSLPAAIYWSSLAICALGGTSPDPYSLGAAILGTSFLLSLRLLRDSGIKVACGNLVDPLPRIARSAFLARVHIAALDVLPVFLLTTCIGAAAAGAATLITRLFGPVALLFSTAAAVLQRTSFLADSTASTMLLRACYRQLGISILVAFALIGAVAMATALGAVPDPGPIQVPLLNLASGIALYRAMYLNVQFSSQVLLKYMQMGPLVALDIAVLLAVFMIPQPPNGASMALAGLILVAASFVALTLATAREEMKRRLTLA